MKEVTTQNAGTAERLAEIQKQVFDLCAPKSGAQYDEFYKVTTERGFTRITLPRGH
ncbi:MAG: hypothetical protein RBS08_00835 [Bdellovibrionales bacterium]|jgi:hypothetical protein|nr:hypothetical protein [Bdellovibrionales bacterium]